MIAAALLSRQQRQEQHQLCVDNGERSVMSTSSGGSQAETMHKLRAIRERISAHSGAAAAATTTRSLSHTCSSKRMVFLPR
jgi:hypothetical protein